MDSLIHPYAKLPWLPLGINIIYCGWGTTVSGALKEGGPDVKTIIVGLVSTSLYYFGIILSAYTMGLAIFLPICIWILNVYIGYKGMQKAQQ